MSSINFTNLNIFQSQTIIGFEKIEIRLINILMSQHPIPNTYYLNIFYFCTKLSGIWSF